MDKTNHLDFTKLLGFDTVSCELSKGLDLRDDTLGSKLGAKVGGGPESTSPSLAIDFQEDTMGAKLGAKIGNEPGGADS